MLKIFTTQLIGKMKQLENAEQETFEDIGRLLAQSIVSESSVYLYGVGDLAGIMPISSAGEERLPNIKILDTENLPTTNPMDVILLLSPESGNEEILTIARKVRNQDGTMIGISVIKEGTKEGLNDIADIHIDLKLTQPLVPLDSGDRVGFPLSLLAIYVYHCLLLFTFEILEDYND